MHQKPHLKVIAFLLFTIFCPNSYARLDLDRPYPSGLWRQDYTKLVKEKLSSDRGQALINIAPEMVAELCPRYDRLKRSDRENFWATFFMALAYAESDFKNTSGPKAGIMQLTCDSNARIGYGCTSCTSNSRLRNSPLIGLDCSMNIISHWVRRGRLLGKHPYFETLRANSHFRRKVKPTIQAYEPSKCESRYRQSPGDWITKASQIEREWPY